MRIHSQLQKFVVVILVVVTIIYNVVTIQFDYIKNLNKKKTQKRECHIRTRLSKKCDVVRVIDDVVSMKYNYIIILNKTKCDITLPIVIIQYDYI